MPQKYVISDIQPWEVYRLPLVRQMTPPKPKYVLVIDVYEEYFRGFVLNRKPRPLVEQNPQLMNHYARITKEHNDFLIQDSLIDCSEIYQFGEQDIEEAQYCTVIDRECALDVKRACDYGSLLTPKVKRLIAAMPLP